MLIVIYILRQMETQVSASPAHHSPIAENHLELSLIRTFEGFCLQVSAAQFPSPTYTHLLQLQLT